MSVWSCSCGRNWAMEAATCPRCGDKRPEATPGQAIRPQRGRKAVERKIKALRVEADDLEALLRAFPVDAAEEPNRALCRLVGAPADNRYDE